MVFKWVVKEHDLINKRPMDHIADLRKQFKSLYYTGNID